MTDVVAALGHALAHFLWQGALIGAFAALSMLLLRDARPQARYAVLCIALLACVLVPLATFAARLAPSAHVPVIGSAFRLVELPAIAELPTTLETSTQHIGILPWTVALWLGGVVFLSLRMASGLRWIRRLRREVKQTALQASWQSRLDTLAAGFDLRRHVELHIVDSLDTPVSTGWRRPAVLLPAALPARMPPELVDALLAHELAHVRRHDFAINALQSIVEALLFQHPAVWWLSRRIRIERELIADELATAACTPRRLARALSGLSDLQRTFAAPQLALAAHGGRLLPRIERLVRPGATARAGGRIAIALVALALACIASFAFAQGSAPRAGLDRTVRETWAIARHDASGISVYGPQGELADVVTATRPREGDAFYVYRAGNNYRVTDAALIARARAVWDEVDALNRQIDALGARADTARGKDHEDVVRRYRALTRDYPRAIERFEHELHEVSDDALERGLAAPA